nr:type II toxin-antitoxin system VapC family toxin [Rhizobium sp. L1K21]
MLVDTNVLSEVTKPQPDVNVLQWLDTIDEDRTFISVISIAEIRRGIVLLDEGRRRNALEEWLSHDLPQRFEHRILPVTEKIAETWGDLMGHARRTGRGLSSMDGIIAATAVAHELCLATRNIKYFQGLGVELFDPWQQAKR